MLVGICGGLGHLLLQRADWLMVAHNWGHSRCFEIPDRMCYCLVLQYTEVAIVSVMVHSVGTARDRSSDGIMHSGGAGWRDSARLEARVGATRGGAGVADEHSRGAGWRDSARPEARVSATRDGADVEGQCGIASLSSEMAVPVECDRAIVVRDRAIRCGSR